MKKVGDNEVGVEIEGYRDNVGAGNLSTKHPDSGKKVNLVVDLNEGDMVQGKVASHNVCYHTGADDDSLELRDSFSTGFVECASGSNKEFATNGNHDMADNDIVTKSGDDIDKIGFKCGALIPKFQGQENQNEKEGEYFVSDLVWGKVRSHPWWPGQIFKPSEASEKAMEYFKRDSYLIAYFGDQTFAWNDSSNIRPFRQYYSVMEKQSKAKTFRGAVDRALDEVSRRVECGLVCCCLPEGVRDRVKCQVVMNAGIQEQSSRIYGGDSFSSVDSFVPAKLVDFIQSSAEAPNADINRLQVALARAQLLAFSRWKGRYFLPVLEDLSGTMQHDGNPTVLGEDQSFDEVMEIFPGKDDSPAGKAKLSAEGSLCKQRRWTMDVHTKKKCVMRSMPTIISSVSSGGKVHKEEFNHKMTFGSSNKKCKADGAMALESKVKLKKRLSLPMVNDQTPFLPRKRIKFGEQIKVARKLMKDSSPKSSSSGSQRAVDSHSGKLLNVSGSGLSTSVDAISHRTWRTPQEYPPTDEIFSELTIAAQNPMDSHTSLSLVAGFFFDFRKSICLENILLQGKEESSGKLKSEEFSELVTAETLTFEGMEDSYWTDRIIQNSREEWVHFGPECQTENSILVAEPEDLDRMNLNKNSVHVINMMVDKPGGVDLMNLNSDNDHDIKPRVTDEDTINSSPIDDSAIGYSPTVLILNFTDLESIPSVADLNKIFNRYGPLNELDTEILCKSMRAKVVFKKRSDAETAFSSTGKFSIFGPSLVSYRLRYLPKSYKASTTLKVKRGRKKAPPVEQNGM